MTGATKLLNTPKNYLLTLTKANTQYCDYQQILFVRRHSKFDGMLRFDINICIWNKSSKKTDIHVQSKNTFKPALWRLLFNFLVIFSNFQ